MAIFPEDDPEYASTYVQEAAMVDAAELIAEALERADISKAELARRLGVSRSEITARLIGERNITVRKLAETLNALGAQLDLSIAEVAPKRVVDAADPRQRWQPPALADAHDEHWPALPKTASRRQLAERR